MKEPPALYQSAGFGFTVVNCPGGTSRWSAAMAVPAGGLILVRSGMFLLRCAGREVLASPATGLVLAPGSAISVAHPRGADRYISITAPAEWLPAAPAESPGVVAFRVDGRLELAQSLLRASDHAAAAGYLAILLAVAVGVNVPLARPSAAAAVAFAAQIAILADEPSARGLEALACSLGVSPYRLSRAFAATTGITLTRYRNRARVSRVLERLHGGERNLARLAGDLGFSDQSHLTRTVKAELGLPPGDVRKMISDVALPWSSADSSPA